MGHFISKAYHCQEVFPCSRYMQEGMQRVCVYICVCKNLCSWVTHIRRVLHCHFLKIHRRYAMCFQQGSLCDGVLDVACITMCRFLKMQGARNVFSAREFV